MYDIKVQFCAPELTDAINRLATALTGGKIETPPPAADIPAATEPEGKPPTFDEVHTALLELKKQKNAAAVRGVLDAVGAKTVQDIPDTKYTEALQLARAELEA